KSLKTIEQLPGDFQVGLHSQAHEYQLIDLFWCANSKRRRADTRHGKIWLGGGGTTWRAGVLRRRLGGAGLSLPNGQTVDRAPSEIPVVGDTTNHFGKAATALDEVELLRLAAFIRRERAGDTRCIARGV